MPSTIKVLALPDTGWKDAAEKSAFHRSAQTTAGVGSVVILDYTSADDLVARIQAAIQQDPDGPCLAVLDIWAHSNPQVANAFCSSTVGSWGAKFKTLRWCDSADLYLSGCNTGLQTSPGPPATNRGPIAKLLADSMPFVTGTFESRITVHGSKGYLTNCFSTGGTRTERTLGGSGPGVSGFFAFVSTLVATGSVVSAMMQAGTHSTPPTHTAYPGAQDTTGSDVWLDFPNWT